MSKLIIITVVLGSALCALIAVYQFLKAKKLFRSINSMLDYAIDGSFKEGRYDESALSALESKLHKYLTSSLISANKVNEERAAVQQLLSDISHQTMTPISNIILYGQLLEEQPLGGDSMELVASLNKQTDKLSFLMVSLVKLSRLEGGIVTSMPQRENVAYLIRDACEQLKAKALQKNIELTSSSGDIFACFDIKWTGEALCNVIDNAIKYTGEGGRVSVSAKKYELFCRIDVSDTGIGISEDEQAKVFARFYRSSDAGLYDGVGIGLYLTRLILAQQGGYIKVVSERGNGSLFSLFLPY